MKIFKLVIYFGLAASATAPNLSFYGTLNSYDKSTATIKLESGATIKVPKTALATPVDGMIAGKAKVIATLSVELLSEMNPNFFKPISNDSKGTSR